MLNYYFCNENNFGDIFNIYFVEKILHLPDSKIIDPNTTNTAYYLFVGSLVHNIYISDRSIICGIGIGSRNEIFPKTLRDPILVRGPITRKRFLELGYKCPDKYGDPMLILPLYYSPKISKQYDIGFIPHKIDTDLFIKSIPTNLPYSWHVIDLSCNENSIEDIINQIISCKKTVSSSLHGLIASHAYKIPTMWINTINKLCGDNIKYIDYYESLQIYNPQKIELDFYNINYHIDKYPQPSNIILNKRISDIKNMIDIVSLKRSSFKHINILEIIR